MSIEVILITIIGGILLVITETFVPGGVVGAVGIVLVLIGVVAGFTHGVTMGFGLLAGAVVVGILLFYLWMKFFPKSIVGRKVILQQDASTWHGWDTENPALFGRLGTTSAPLHPTGIAVIEGKRIDVVTRGEMVEAGRKVRVIEVEGNRVVVAEVREEAAP